MKHNPQSIFLTLGTRGSPLALAQAEETANLLAKLHAVERQAISLEIIKTTGDSVTDRPLSEAGGKGLFTKELDEALIRSFIDIGVHSAKDLPTQMPEGIVIAGYLPREDVRDALICPSGSWQNLEQGAKVGTASLRRAAQIKRLRPDLQTVLLRGNIHSRLAKVAKGECQATLLALAGLKRLELCDHVTEILSLEDFLPACGQGAIAITARAADKTTLDAIAPICDKTTALALAAERAFLHRLEGSCRTPIAGLCTLHMGELFFRGMVLSPEGASEFIERRCTPNLATARHMGERAASHLLERLPSGFLSR